MSALLASLTVAGAVVAAAGQPLRATSLAATRTVEFAAPAAVENTARPAARRWTRRLVHGLLTGAVTWLLGPLLVIGAAVSVFAVLRLRKITEQRGARRAIDRDLPEALDLFVLLLEAGVSLRGVIGEMSRRGPHSTRPAFAHVADRLEIGEPFAEAIVQLRTELGAGAVALVDLVTASHRYGLPMAQVVGQLSTEARAARRRRNEAMARALPVKLSFPLVVCTLPSFVLLAVVPAVMAALTSLGSEPW